MDRNGKGTFSQRKDAGGECSMDIGESSRAIGRKPSWHLQDSESDLTVSPTLTSGCLDVHCTITASKEKINPVSSSDWARSSRQTKARVTKVQMAEVPMPV
jgi:hypothetical protein